MVAVTTAPRLSEREPACDSLIGMLMGSQLDALPSVVRAVHAGSGDTCCAGTLDVRQARSKLGRLVARMMGMPASEGDTPVTLVIERSAIPGERCARERWCRSFAGELMVSDQAIDGARLVESIGRLELTFELQVVDDRLIFRHLHTRASLGSRRLLVPRWLAPRVEASVGAAPTGDVLDVSVRIVAPVLGDLLSYAGALTPREAP